MSFFTNLRADRLIAEIKAADDSDGHKSSLEKLVRLGASAIPRILGSSSRSCVRFWTRWRAPTTGKPPASSRC